MRLSIVVPAHNEEQRIGRMLERYLPFFAGRYASDVEFLVVINGSTDRTEEVVKRYEGRYSMLRHLVEPCPIGKGGALMVGFAAARGDRIGFVDADGSTPPEAFQDLVDQMGDNDAIVASRWRQGAVVSPRQPLLRRMASRVFNVLVRLFFGLRLTDTQCGAKLLTREAVRKVLPSLGITQWAFDVDLLVQLRRNGYRMAEIPTTWHDVAGSKIEMAWVSTEMLASLVRLRLLYSPFRWLVPLYGVYVAPFIHPPGMEHDRLFRHSLLLLAGAQVGSVFNLLFQVAMVRMLSRADYGTLAAMLGLLGAVGMPLGALGQTVTHYSAALIKEGRSDRVRSLVLGFVRDLGMVLVPALILAYLGRDALAGFFHLPGTGPILVTSFTFAFLVLGPIVAGAMNGAQLFLWCAAIGVASSLARLLAGALCVVAGWAATGALLANAFSLLLSLGLGAVALRRHLPDGAWRHAERVAGAYAYFGRYLVALAGYAFLANADVVLVKHYFSPDRAGQFAAAAMVARVVFFLPQPVSVAMFPKVVSAGNASRQSWRTLIKALLLVGLVTGIAAAVCSLLPGLVLRLVTGDSSPEGMALVRGMVWALSPLSVAFVIMNYQLAQRRFAVAIPLVVCAAGYAAGVAVAHATLFQIIAMLSVASWGVLGLCIVGLPWRALSGNDAERREA